ncbi:hypothetical protein FACS1894191_2620 [Clostridia bacterium]|nr:hypothetical protein FACS1894191_2620 [Clostridia bacterium]
MENTPEIETERLILRKFTMNDTEAFFSLMSDAETNIFLPWFPLDTMEKAGDFLRKNYLEKYGLPTGFHYAICLKPGNMPVGYVGLSADDSHDLGYGLRKELWGEGIATEACRAVAEKLTESDIPYITATHDVNNPGSGQVMKKIGMVYRYSYEEQWQPKNIRVTFRLYQLNLDGQDDRVYQKYWNMYPVHFIEENL